MKKSATTYLERPWLWTYSGIVGSERAMPKTLEGRYDRRDDFDIWRGFGIQLGQGPDWPWESLEDLYDYRLNPVGLTFRQFMDQGGFLNSPKEYRRYEKTGFATATGKIELYSKTFEALGYDPLPQYREPPESPYSRPDVLKDWKLEGGKRVSIVNGRLVLESEPGQKDNHLVCWLTKEMPDAFLLEFTVRPQNRREGLCCGGPLLAGNPARAKNIAAGRVGEARLSGAELLVTACPTCLLVLREAAGKEAGGEKPIKVLDLFELLRGAGE